MNSRFFRIANVVLIAFLLLPGNLAFAAGSGAGQTPPPPAADAAPASITGVFAIRWGDPRDPHSSPRTEYTITPERSKPVKLEMGSSLPFTQLTALNGKRISLKGQWLDTRSQSQRFKVAAFTSGTGSLEPAPIAGPEPWVTVLCKFADVEEEPQTYEFFVDMYSNNFPGLDHYWNEISYGNINMEGSTSTAQWYTLPHPREHYVYDIDEDGKEDVDFYAIAQDCTGMAENEIDYTTFVGINMFFNAELDGNSWGGNIPLTLDGEFRSWRATWEPPWGWGDISVIAHETGHGFGLPHSSGQYGETYDNQWDVMSDPYTNCVNLRDSTYGCVGQGTIAYHRDIQGWIPSERQKIIGLNERATITLEPLQSIPAQNYMMAQVLIDDSYSHFYTVEVRKKVGYDVQLPGEAVIIHEVTTGSPIPAQVIDIDNNGNTGDAGAQWEVGEVFSDPDNNISITVVSETPSGGFVVTIANGQPPNTCQEVIAGWKGEYWNNPTLNGERTLCRDDAALNFDWGTNAPDFSLPVDGFSARWTRSLPFELGSYQFKFFHDDGARLFVDGVKVFENWCSGCRLWDSVTLPMTLGSHTVIYEIFDYQGTAAARLDIWPLDAYEPDNTALDAKSILSGTPQNHSISPPGDVDYVKFTVSEPSALVIETNGPTNSDTQMWLYTSTMVEIAVDDNSGSGDYSRIERTCGGTSLAAGDYFVKTSAQNDTQAIPAYALTMSLTPCTQPQKPDLVIDSITFDPAPPRINQPFTYHVIVRNPGEMAISTPFRVDLYVGSTPAGCSQAGNVNQIINELAAGATFDVALTGAAMSSAGPFTITAFVDSFCSVGESIENNNLASETLRLAPGSFSKNLPGNSATGISTKTSLTWESAVGATQYEYCIEKGSDNTCAEGWKPVIGASVTPGNLLYETTYYWQVRAVNGAGKTPANDSWWSFTTQPLPPQCARTWQANIAVHDAGSGSGTVTIGQGAIYTDGLDTTCGEAALPAAPPAGTFDIRLVLPTSASNPPQAAADFRADGLEKVTWKIRAQPGAGGYPITLTWNPAALPIGPFRLQDLAGLVIDVDMKAQSSYTLTDTTINTLKIVYTAFQTACVTVNVKTGWNLVSAPVTPTNQDMRLSTLYPDVKAPAYTYSGQFQYQAVNGLDSLQTGKGYWLWFNEPHDYQLCGRTVASGEIALVAGWNLIGAYEAARAVPQLSSNPNGIVTPQIFGFGDAYQQASTLNPGTGYWAYATQAGTLYLNGAPGEAAAAQSMSEQALASPVENFRFTVTVSSGQISRALTFGIDPQASNAVDASLDVLTPPAPPPGSFYALLSSGLASYQTDLRALGPAPMEFAIRFHTASAQDTVRLSWNPAAIRKLGMFVLKDMQTGEQYQLNMIKAGEISIPPNSTLSSGVKIVFYPLIVQQELFLPAIVR